MKCCCDVVVVVVDESSCLLGLRNSVMQFGKKSRSKFKIHVSFQVLLGEKVAAKILKCSAGWNSRSEKKKSVREEKY